MAFCSNCGTQLQGDERFCVNCGRAVGGATGAATAPFQPISESGELPPGANPIPVVMPQTPARSKQRILMIGVVLLVIAAGYYVTHQQAPMSKADSAALAAQQVFDAHWETADGYVLISRARWTNRSDVIVQSVTLQCDQYDQSGSDLNQAQITLNGPLQPGASDVFDSFKMGAVAANLNDVKCTIVGAQQAAEQANQYGQLNPPKESLNQRFGAWMSYAGIEIMTNPALNND